MNGLFVTATDTGVGKTLVTAALALALRARGLDVGVAKPVQSGSLTADPDGDAMVLKRLVGLPDEPEEIAPLAFSAPLAPLVAARLEGRELELDAVCAGVRAQAERHELVLVEGAGGLLVPIGPSWTVAELAAELGLPLLVVARPGLGTVNHTLLTVEEARRRGLDPIGVVLNGLGRGTDASAATNAELIESFGAVPVLGQIPWLDGEVTPDRLSRVAAEHLDLDRLLAGLTKEEAHV